MFDDTFRDGAGFFPDTHAIHLWNDLLAREAGFDKNAGFHSDSLIERLKERYLGG
jgi:hypothetical protein